MVTRPSSHPTTVSMSTDFFISKRGWHRTHVGGTIRGVLSQPQGYVWAGQSSRAKFLIFMFNDHSMHDVFLPSSEDSGSYYVWIMDIEHEKGNLTLNFVFLFCPFHT